MKEAYIINGLPNGNNKPNCPFIINMQLTGVFDIEYENNVEDKNSLKNITHTKCYCNFISLYS